MTAELTKEQIEAELAIWEDMLRAKLAENAPTKNIKNTENGVALRKLALLGLTAQAEITRLQKRARLLEEAIEPFADSAEDWTHKDDGWMFLSSGLTVGDLRRAAAAREGK